MGSISGSSILLFLGTTIFQLLGASLVPATHGMTKPLPIVGVALSYAVGVTLMARLINSGVSLSLVIPLITLAITFGAIAVGVTVYGEGASVIKLLLLGFSTILIGIATHY